MSFRILLTGKNGQVGAELAMLLPGLGEVTAYDHHQLDLSNSDQIRRAIREVRPAIIANAAAYTSVDQAEKEEEKAHAINADAPALMAEEAKRIGAVLVHYSTDYVFDGSSNLPYAETDKTNPINVYGKTKLAGEEAIRAVGAPHLIFRTAWVYGTRGRNFLLTILRLATEREELKVVRDQWGAPTWSHDIAKATATVLLQLSQQGPEAISKFGGTYHMTSGGKASWFEFAKAILEEASRMPQGIPWFETATKGQPLVTRCVTPIPTEEYPTPARRPAYSVLSNSRLKQDFGLELPAWSVQLRAVFAKGGIGG
jgi:dTDP-4-dehydrorhamnose reductase